MLLVDTPFTLLRMSRRPGPHELDDGGEARPSRRRDGATFLRRDAPRSLHCDADGLVRKDEAHLPHVIRDAEEWQRRGHLHHMWHVDEALHEGLELLPPLPQETRV